LTQPFKLAESCFGDLDCISFQWGKRLSETRNRKGERARETGDWTREGETKSVELFRNKLQLVV
jgi:hypothetical protein